MGIGVTEESMRENRSALSTGGDRKKPFFNHHHSEGRDGDRYHRDQKDIHPGLALHHPRIMLEYPHCQKMGEKNTVRKRSQKVVEREPETAARKKIHQRDADQKSDKRFTGVSGAERTGQVKQNRKKRNGTPHHPREEMIETAGFRSIGRFLDGASDQKDEKYPRKQPVSEIIGMDQGKVGCYVDAERDGSQCKPEAGQNEGQREEEIGLEFRPQRPCRRDEAP